MKKNKTLIIHFRNKSIYPPVLNVHEFISKHGVDCKIIDGQILKINIFEFNILNKLFLHLNYFLFTFKSLFFILKNKNQSVIYYESLSALPIYISITFFRISKLKLFIHYHEYFSDQNEYQRQSFYERFGRRLEKKLFYIAKWISHTNEYRLDFFRNEFPQISNEVLKVMPNYPPKSWLEQQIREKNINNIIKLVHIGSISLQDMYLQEVLNQFGSNPKFAIDFYSHKFTDEVKKSILQHYNCAIHSAIDYQDIPKLKGIYDVGLVLYKGLSLNFIYNAPNKIFEYLGLDLDVWCSDKLITAKDYQRLDCYPKMLMVDFEKLKDFDINKALNKEGLKYFPSPYVCEPVYEELLKELLK